MNFVPVANQGEDRVPMTLVIVLGRTFRHADIVAPWDAASAEYEATSSRRMHTVQRGQSAAK
jgi:hypothetical protein